MSFSETVCCNQRGRLLLTQTRDVVQTRIRVKIKRGPVNVCARMTGVSVACPGHAKANRLSWSAHLKALCCHVEELELLGTYKGFLK